MKRDLWSEGLAYVRTPAAEETGAMEQDRFDAAVARIEAMSRLMDSMFAIPGTNVRLGADAIIGLVPVLGDLVSQAISTYIIWEARQLGVSRWTLVRMIGNTALDTVVGMVPVAGDAFDIMFKANMKNLALVKKHIENRGSRGRVIETAYTRMD